MMNSEGTFRTFDTGAVRDTASRKPMIHLISPFFLQDLGEWLRFACQDRKPEPYPPRNWEKGMPFSETLGSGFRHLVGIMIGDETEDHIAAFGFAAMALAHYRHEIKAGRMDPAIDDMPKYNQQGILVSRDPTDMPDHLTTNEISHEELVEAWSASEQEQDVEPQSNEGRVFRTLHGRTLEPDNCNCGDFKSCPDCSTEPPTFYVTGPMRGIPQLNFPAFDEVAKQARAKGLTVISPAELDREHGIDPINDPASVDRANEADPNLLQTIAQRDCEIILNLKKDRGDGLILVWGWSRSVGGRAEVALALWLRLKFKNEYLDDLDSDKVTRILFNQEIK